MLLYKNRAYSLAPAKRSLYQFLGIFILFFFYIFITISMYPSKIYIFSAKHIVNATSPFLLSRCAKKTELIL